MANEILNKTIGRYEIKELIGEGAMAMVYRAYDPEINRSVAFKVLKEDHCVDELRSLAELRHHHWLQFTPLTEHCSE